MNKFYKNFYNYAKNKVIHRSYKQSGKVYTYLYICMLKRLPILKKGDIR